MNPYFICQLYAVGHTSLPLDSCLRTDDFRKDCVGDNSQDPYRVREQRGDVGRNVVA